MCCDHGTPTSTRSPASAALSRSQTGGTVKTRTTVAPISAISPKSRTTTSHSGNCLPCEPTAKGPYVTPLTKNFRSPAKKNLPRTRIGARHAAASDALGGRDHLANRMADAGAEIGGNAEAAPQQEIERLDVRLGQVLDVDVVAHRGAVRRRIVGAEHVDLRPPAHRRLQHQR